MKYLHPVLGAGELAADRLEQANINPQTGLATDYLNHFNEVTMLLEMLPDMPDCAQDVLAWAPLDYEEHFRNSSFKDRHLAILAYHAAPALLRDHLSRRTAQINKHVTCIQDRIRSASNPADVAGEAAAFAAEHIKPLISAASGVIHGYVEPMTDTPGGDRAQAEIDAMFP